MESHPNSGVLHDLSKHIVQMPFGQEPHTYMPLESCNLTEHNSFYLNDGEQFHLIFIAYQIF